MQGDVTILEKPEGQTWSRAETGAMLAGSVECTSLGRFPRRLVAMNKPHNGKTFQQLLGHSNFTEREVPYGKEWD